ncbi:MAG TPA: hypothetical protein PLC07_06410 [Bacillota bacterium]|nr:hypothetical protein [Bacillota bacterium]HPT88558.1 hypothetical protein [Bacillota bacterium]
MNTAENGNYLERLRTCYVQLAEAVQSETASPEYIVALSETADKIIDEIKKDSAFRAAVRPEEVLELKEQAEALIRLIKTEMEKRASHISNLQSGRRAVKGYHSLPVGMGISEGKFMDIKK